MLHKFNNLPIIEQYPIFESFLYKFNAGINMVNSDFPSKYYPFGYYAYFLSDSTLTTKIREKSWDLETLFPMLKKAKSDLEGLSRRLGPDLSEDKAQKLQNELKSSIRLLANEIRTGFKDLKLINFYDSALFYLYFRLLQHVLALCKKEEEILSEKKNKAASDSMKIKGKLEEIKKAKNETEKKIKENEKRIGRLSLAESELRKVNGQIFKRLRKIRWGAEKLAQHEFSFEKLTLRSMENLNRKIKVEAMKVKQLIPYKNFLMKKIQKQGCINPEDVVMLADNASNIIDRISKDVAYSSKLVADFEEEINRLGGIIENLKKKVISNKKIKEEAAKDITKPWDGVLAYLKKEANKDLMQIFRNTFVEYKLIGTRLKQAA